MEEQIAKVFVNLKRKELPSLAKPELEECVGADVKLNKTYRHALSLKVG